jgi:hypothetical protein
VVILIANINTSVNAIVVIILLLVYLNITYVLESTFLVYTCGSRFSHFLVSFNLAGTLLCQPTEYKRYQVYPMLKAIYLSFLE